jgi:regulator of RNase E activity RraA
MTANMQNLAARAANIATATFANALDDFGLADTMILPTIKAVAPGMRFAGPAVTVRESVGPVGTYTSADFKVGAMIDAAGPGDVVVVAGEGANISTWGGMASFAAKKKGVAGLLADVGVRDVEEMVEFEFSVFARHLTPLTGRTRLKIEAINEPVIVDGVPIAPGDIVVADGTGVVVLPANKAEEIIDNAERYSADDAAAIKDLDGGLTFTEAMAKYTRI